MRWVLLNKKTRVLVGDVAGRSAGKKMRADPFRLAEPTPERHNMEYKSESGLRKIWAHGDVDHQEFADMKRHPNMILQTSPESTMLMWVRGNVGGEVLFFNSTGGPTVETHTKDSVERLWLEGDAYSYGTFRERSGERPNALRTKGEMSYTEWFRGPMRSALLERRPNAPSRVSRKSGSTVSKTYSQFDTTYTVPASLKAKYGKCFQHARKQFGFQSCSSTAVLNLILSSEFLNRCAMLQINSLDASIVAEWERFPLTYPADMPRRLMVLKIVFDHICGRKRVSPSKPSEAVACLHTTSLFLREALAILGYVGLQVQLLNIPSTAMAERLLDNATTEKEVEDAAMLTLAMSLYPRKQMTTINYYWSADTDPKFSSLQPQVLLVDVEDPDAGKNVLIGCYVSASFKNASIGHALAGVACYDKKTFEPKLFFFDSDYGELDFTWDGPVSETFELLGQYFYRSSGSTLSHMVLTCIYVTQDAFHAVMSLPKRSFFCGGKAPAWSPSTSPKPIRRFSAEDLGMPYIPSAEPRILVCNTYDLSKYYGSSCIAYA